MESYVIIGNGVAAVSCIEGIRSVDKAGSINVISAEKYPVYCRPLISYYLEGKTDEARMMYRKPDFYDENSVTVSYGKSAVKIDRDGKEVLLDDGSSLPFTKLCVAAGSSPFVPPFEGLDTVEKKVGFMTLDDAKTLEKTVDESSRVLIIGAGLIGLKCAEGLYGRVKSITVCDLADRILSSVLDTKGAEIVQKHLEECGMNFMLSDSVTSFDKTKATMKSGKTVEFDVLVLAVGVRANSGIIREIGGEVNRGIVVDEKMRTSLDDIFACGDCTEGLDVSLGEKRVLALMPNANLQGYCAGVNMAGGEKVFDNAIPLNSLGLLGLHIMTAGTCFDKAHGGETYIEKNGEGSKKLYIKDGVMTGLMLIGDTARAGIYTSMVRNRTPLCSVNFEILKKSPSTAAFSPEKRRNFFGGVI